MNRLYSYRKNGETVDYENSNVRNEICNNKESSLDIITYHIFSKTCMVEKHIPKHNKHPDLYGYIYHDNNNDQYEICRRRWFEVPKMNKPQAGTIPTKYDKTYEYPSGKGKDFIKSWEALRLQAYDDSQGYATIGYGHLIEYKSIKSLKIPNEFKNGITKEKANELFNIDLERFEDAVRRDIAVNLHQYEFDALVSLLYNCGESFLKNGKAPKLLNHLNNMNYESAANEFVDITRGGVGLKERRQDEINIFNNDNYKNHN